MKRLLVCLPLLFVLVSCNKSEPPKPRVEVPINTAKVLTKEVPFSLWSTLSVVPDKDSIVRVRSKIQGTVQSIKVQVGDRVERGSLLAIVKAPDTTDLYSQEVSLRIQTANAERIYRLKKELYELGAIPKTELLDAETNLKVLESQLEAVRRKLKLLGGGFGYASIYSPIDGVVYQININVGDTVDTSTDMISIVKPGKTLFVAYLPPEKAYLLKEHQTVKVLVDDQRTYEATVLYVSDVVDPSTKSVKVYMKPLEVSDIKIGSFLSVRLILGTRKYQVIPKSSLVYREGKYYVYVLENNKPKKVEVQMIEDLGDGNVAVSGLEEGKEVITNPVVEGSL
ncbi:efflux RND transporter periplasmic adaptor subunit [Thermocrinis minervae]|uniref:Membrane fusion protein, cobalt-zinc-cadmium efflux system n=1 Tax=Thermocrinis minervae TaxID=381751 RepID=A0A1M6RN62_9AQUI|nr:efflux RND transporter periplasmic adaptor subunit [Thermocrinis minervae]SHK33895.1 membrane fusion protein, cobalt-zinc-cadmium efflux system [Thermocrinis minervae]